MPQQAFTEEVTRTAQTSVLCWLATVDAEGMPNVSPKEMWHLHGDRHLLIANIASPTSARNIATNPAVCVSFVNVFTQKGTKIKGTAQNWLRGSPDYAANIQPFEALTKGRFIIHSIMAVEVHSVEAIIAPSYRFFPSEVSEAAQIASAMQTYGVQAASGLPS